MNTQIEANTLTAGDYILDGIVSRVENVIHLEMDNAVYVTVLDGNGYTNYLRLNNYADVTKVDWTDEEWNKFFGPLEKVQCDMCGNWINPGDFC